MKKIEEIKKQYAESHGIELPIYTYQGEQGILYNDEAAKRFIPLEEVEKMDIDLDYIAGAEYAKNGDEIVNEPYQNPENEECIIWEDWIEARAAESDRYIRELCTTTDRYYSWTSERKIMIDAIQQDINKYDEKGEDEKDENELIELLKMDKKSWDKTVSYYSDPCGWQEFHERTADFVNVLDEVLDWYYGRWTEGAEVVAEHLGDFI